MRKLFFGLIGLLLTAASGLPAQSFLYVRNNSWLPFELSLQHKGNVAPPSLSYSLQASQLRDWEEDLEVFGTLRDTNTVHPGDSVVYALAMHHGTDTLFFEFELLPIANGSSMRYRMHGNGFNSGWLDDGNFHDEQVVIGGRSLQLRFRPDNDDSQQSRNLRLAIHETEIYAIDQADFANPNVINVMAYNIQMLPLGLVGMPQPADRADLLPATFSPYQDVVIFEEAFDILPRLLNLIPAMEDAGFVHNSGILNDYLPFNGGVIIFSKWPIEATDEYDFELCGPNSQDCLANKGIMYTKINKLGKKYHIFGTHFDAGSDSLDLAAKNLQFAEMRDFITAQNIPSSEPAIFGGDFNTSPLNDHNLYFNLHDSLAPFVPVYSGFPNSTMRRDTGDIIDHVMVDSRHLLPLESEVFITTFRSIDPVLWDLSDFSDHRSAIARFRFPDIAIAPGDQDVCPGDALGFSSSSDIAIAHRWFHDGNPMPVTGFGFSIPSATLQDSGLYEMEASYQVQMGLLNDAINSLLYPNGLQSYNCEALFRAGFASVGPQHCTISATDPTENQGWTVFPNPSNGHVTVRKLGQFEPGDWTLRDLQGRVLAGGKLVGLEQQIDLSELAAGSYILGLKSRKNFHNLPILLAK